tara:strand:+ start:272 stop:436 length:165 start_codon:yes stop_codon:yes gene_type:complete
MQGTPFMFILYQQEDDDSIMLRIDDTGIGYSYLESAKDFTARFYGRILVFRKGK